MRLGLVRDCTLLTFTVFWVAVVGFGALGALSDHENGGLMAFVGILFLALPFSLVALVSGAVFGLVSHFLYPFYRKSRLTGVAVVVGLVAVLVFVCAHVINDPDGTNGSMSLILTGIFTPVMAGCMVWLFALQARRDGVTEG